MAEELQRRHLDVVVAATVRLSGTDVTLTALRLATTWTDRAYQAMTYCKGRVLLAAATPRTSILVWAAKASISASRRDKPGLEPDGNGPGDALAGLLDTYADERHPVAEQFWTGRAPRWR